MLESIREPERVCQCSNVTVLEKQGYVQRSLTANGETFTENIVADSTKFEIVHRSLYSADTDANSVVALRRHPLHLEFFSRKKDGSRVECSMPSSASLPAVEAYVREAKHMEKAKKLKEEENQKMMSGAYKDGSGIQLKVNNLMGRELQVITKKTMPMRKLMETSCKRLGMQASHVRFLVNGERIAPGDTAGKLGLENGGELVVVYAED